MPVDSDLATIIAEALTRRRPPLKATLRVEGPSRYGRPCVTIKSDEAALYVSVDPPGAHEKGWKLRVPVEVIIRYDPSDHGRVSRLHEVVADALRGLGFTRNEEGLTGPDEDDGCHSHASEWSTVVSDPAAVAEMIGRLVELPLTQYPDGDAWMFRPIPLSTDEAEALVAAGVPVEEDERTVGDELSTDVGAAVLDLTDEREA